MRGSGTEREGEEAGQVLILLSQATSLLAHIANSGPVPLFAPAFRTPNGFRYGHLLGDDALASGFKLRHGNNPSLSQLMRGRLCITPARKFRILSTY